MKGYTICMLTGMTALTIAAIMILMFGTTAGDNAVTALTELVYPPDLPILTITDTDVKITNPLDETTTAREKRDTETTTQKTEVFQDLKRVKRWARRRMKSRRHLNFNFNRKIGMQSHRQVGAYAV